MPLAFPCQSCDLEVCSQTLFLIGSEIPAQLIVSLCALFQLSIIPRDLSFADRRNGDGLCLGPSWKAIEGLQTFGQGHEL